MVCWIFWAVLGLGWQDFQTGVPAEKILSVHGTLGKIECEFCGADYPISAFRDALKTNIKVMPACDIRTWHLSADLLAINAAEFHYILLSVACHYST